MRHTHILCTSYQHWTGLPLLDHASMEARDLFDAPFAVVSHGTQPDPVFNYANRQAQALFGMSWEELTQLPSRLSAEEINQAERELLLRRVEQNGYVDDYSGVRIGKGGRRFTIHNATVWNLLDEQGDYCGQAALIRHWSPI